VLLRLYPVGWQRRYGEEMGALLEDDPPSVRGLATLVTGALRAHARPGPWRSTVAPGERVALSVWATFACWIALSVAGASFQKETEEGTFALAASQHGVLGIARTVVIVGALLGAAAIAVGGLPLLWQALREARSGGWTLRIALVMPLACLLLLAAVTAALLALTPEQLEGTSTALRLALVVPWWTAGAAFALACALAPRVALARFEASPRALRRASFAGLVLLSAMALVTAGLAVYCVGLVRLEPPLSAQSGGPLWPSTSLVLAAGAALAAACTALASVSATRAFAAARR
jgi:hypothetical protein